jgi:cytochrome c2
VYRLLRGNGEIEGGVQFLTSGQIFNAVAPSSYNRAESATDTRVAYGKNVSEFCSACHPDMHEPISTKLTHPTSEALGTDELLNYNTYVGSGDMTGSAGSSFDSLVPYQEDNSTDYSAAGTSLRSHANSDGSFTSGPNAGDRVMCLSCHRAHASGWEHATRWDNDVEMIIVDGQWPGTDAASAPANEVKWSKGRVQAERARAYNDKPATNYATYQRSLCNKCHAKD